MRILSPRCYIMYVGAWRGVNNDGLMGYLIYKLEDDIRILYDDDDDDESAMTIF